MFYFYIVRCEDQTLYCGSTNNVEQRIARHNAGRGSKYVRAHGGGQIVHKEIFNTLADAMRREIQVKKWSRQKKENLVKGLKIIN
ncbi:GIY-YIG nuclease family protein [bacterium]|nr:MAG: GIY-YIG nuclease family protein [bacterium]